MKIHNKLYNLLFIYLFIYLDQTKSVDIANSKMQELIYFQMHRLILIMGYRHWQ